MIECGGDTDSTTAIVGGIVGSAAGKAGIPTEWLDDLLEWPRSVHWMERLARQLESTLASGSPARPVTLPVWGVLPRNAWFLLVIFYHGFRRLLPFYGGFSREA